MLASSATPSDVDTRYENARDSDATQGFTLHEMQRQAVTIELPKYKEKVDRFGVELAYKSCMVNDTDFDPARWWGHFGGSTPHLTKIALRILSLTSSSSGCERNWSTFEAIEQSCLCSIQCKFNGKKKDRTLEVLLANDSHSAQEWIVDCNDRDVDEFNPESNMESTDEVLGTNDNQASRQNSKTIEFSMKISSPRVRNKCLKKVNMSRMEFKY
ncbi:unnamed protein product [Lactuca saligna]|uniref:HAT C-terminal dimerisation domain-containing protein n=1 Tax=Lactuca saligna TaxID=75948 RepID=A0AA35YSZ1_LACSI|nr:unnamed protein product [Lactuca saligna]